jgi:hypothetical protein
VKGIGGMTWFEWLCALAVIVPAAVLLEMLWPL